MHEPLKNWSFSTLTEYEKCPHRIILRKQFKIPPNEYMQRGIDIHKQCEDFLNYQGELPSLGYFCADLSKLRDRGAEPEAEYGLTKTWSPELDYDNAYGKCIFDAIDFHNDPRIIDFKTGKPAPIKHQDQSQTYAITAHIHYPDAEIITTEFWYLDSGKITKTSYTIKQLEFYQQILSARVERMMEDTTFIPKPSKFNCKWCSHKEHCEFAYD